MKPTQCQVDLKIKLRRKKIRVKIGDLELEAMMIGVMRGGSADSEAEGTWNPASSQTPLQPAAVVLRMGLNPGCCMESNATRPRIWQAAVLPVLKRKGSNWMKRLLRLQKNIWTLLRLRSSG